MGMSLAYKSLLLGLSLPENKQNFSMLLNLHKRCIQKKEEIISNILQKGVIIFPYFPT